MRGNILSALYSERDTATRHSCNRYYLQSTLKLRSLPRLLSPVVPRIRSTLWTLLTRELNDTLLRSPYRSADDDLGYDPGRAGPSTALPCGVTDCGDSSPDPNIFFSSDRRRRLNGSIFNGAAPNV